MILIFHVSYIVILGRHINLATNNGATQYLLAIIVCIFSFSVNLYRVSIFECTTIYQCYF